MAYQSMHYFPEITKSSKFEILFSQVLLSALIRNYRQHICSSLCDRFFSAGNITQEITKAYISSIHICCLDKIELISPADAKISSTEQERGNLLQNMTQVFGVNGWKNKVSRSGKIAPFLFHYYIFLRKELLKGFYFFIIQIFVFRIQLKEEVYKV